MSIADDVFSIFDRRGSGAYFGERISMTEHAMQAAFFARRESAPDGWNDACRRKLPDPCVYTCPPSAIYAPRIKIMSQC
jgi:hypothetical protein